MLCEDHDFEREIIEEEGKREDDGAKTLRITLNWWCKNEGCWQSKAFYEQYPEIVDALKPLCLKRIHRIDPETRACTDCGLTDQTMRHEGFPDTQQIDLWHDAPIFFTLPKDADDEIVNEFYGIYKSFLKDKGFDHQEGAILPGCETWNAKLTLP